MEQRMNDERAQFEIQNQTFIATNARLRKDIDNKDSRLSLYCRDVEKLKERIELQEKNIQQFSQSASSTALEFIQLQHAFQQATSDLEVLHKERLLIFLI